jgi:phosphatidylserine decarboxylase
VPSTLSRVAVDTLCSEVTRHPGPKSVLVAGGNARTIGFLLDHLVPSDHLTIAAVDSDEALYWKSRIAADDGLRHLGSRLDVVEDLGGSGRYDFVVAPGPLGSAAATAEAIARYRRVLAPGGVLSVLSPLPRSQRDLDRHAFRTDIVLRNRVALRVRHLRFDGMAPGKAGPQVELAPAYSPSSVALTPGMAIDSNGVAAAAILGAVALVVRRARPRSSAWLIPVVAALPVAAFFRDPQRQAPTETDAIVSSADGAVLSVERLHDERFGPGEWLRIAVFLSVLDVHVNRSPVAGRVVDVIRESGGYAMAQTPAAEHNVACYTVLDTPRGRVIVAQRTGLIARRIVHRAPVGRVLARGERFGLIRFGSRTDIYLPADDVNAVVSPGDKVVGGETVLARYR